MTLPPFPAHLALPVKDAALNCTYKLESASKSMLLAYYIADHNDYSAHIHFDEGLRKLAAAAEALGYTLTPIVAPVQAPATAEALFDGVPV